MVLTCFLWPATFIALALSLGFRLKPRVLKPRVEAEQDDTWLVLLACLVPALLYAPTYVLLAQTLGPRAGMLIAAVVVIMLMPTMSAWGKNPSTEALAH